MIRVWRYWNPRPCTPASPRATTLAVGVMVMITAIGGCNWIGYAADVIGGGDQAGQVIVEAQYRGLENQSVAVLVAADEYTLFHHPTVVSALCHQVSSLLATQINGTRVLNPQQATRFQADNPYWNTVANSTLLDRLGVDRLIVIDLTTYALHEPGNNYEWRGKIVANISVSDAQATDPDQLVYATTIQAFYPHGQMVGLINSDRETVRLGLHRMFAQKLVNLFKDHEATRP